MRDYPYSKHIISLLASEWLGGTFLTLHHHAFFLYTIDFGNNRRGKLDMTEMLGLMNSREGVEPFFVENTIALVWINGIVCHAKRREVLEEMRALRRVDAVVREATLYNDAGT